MCTTIELFDEFSTLGITLGICGFISDNAIVDFDDSGWTASDKDRTMQKNWPRLYRRRTATLLKLQRSRTPIVVITWHCIIRTNASRSRRSIIRLNVRFRVPAQTSTQYMQSISSVISTQQISGKNSGSK